ncbi:MAG: hypothetical protein AAFW69_00515 [Pseudomonadota bacterium]
MGEAVFVLSTGRCGTQSLAAELRALAPEAVIEREALGPHYLSRRVFRHPDPAAFLARAPEVAAKFDEIERVLDSGARYIEGGWPVYGWLPFLLERFAGRVRFVHMVRSPYDFAASCLTHRYFSTRADAYAAEAVLTGAPRVGDLALAGRARGFTPFERALFHWLELNAMVAEHHGKACFAGLFRFEEINAPDDAARQALLSAILDRPVMPGPRARRDAFQGRLRVPLTLRDDALQDAVEALARRLGYGEAALAPADDLGTLARRYRRRRSA